jgi:hypothetical protein
VPPRISRLHAVAVFRQGPGALREVKAKVPVRRVTSVAAAGDGKLSEVVS